MKSKKYKHNLKKSHIKLIEQLNKKYSNKIPLNELFNDTPNVINSDSWFSISKSDNFNKDNLLSFNNNINKDKLIKCKKVILLPSNEQKLILLKMLEAYRIMYNRTINTIRKRWFNNERTNINFQYLRTYILKSEKDDLIKQFNVPSHMLDGAIKLACASYKSAFTNFKQGNIKNFQINYLKNSKKSHIFDIEKCSFNKNTFYSTFLGKIMLNNENYDYNDINKDSKLHYNVVSKRFTLLIPIDINEKNSTDNNNYISIDPGVRTFLTCLTNSDIIEINKETNNNIGGLITKIDKITDLNNIRNKKLAIRKRSLKIQNKIQDLHWKSINYLMKRNEKHILIGNWSTKQCISRCGNLNKLTKRICSRLSYYQFLQRLKFKCNEYNKDLHIVDEKYTSKLCSNCCIENETLGSSKIFNCKNCNLCLDRDINSCRNICIKSFSKKFNV